MYKKQPSGAKFEIITTYDEIFNDSWFSVFQMDKLIPETVLKVYTGCPIKKHFSIFANQTHNSPLLFFSRLWNFDHFGVVQKFTVHFSGWGPQYWETSVRTWRAKMTSLNDRYLGNKFLWGSKFFRVGLNSAPPYRAPPSSHFGVEKLVQIISNIDTTNIQAFSFEWD